MDIGVPHPYASGTQAGPNTAATIVIGITFMMVCADVFMLVSHAMGPDQTTTQRVMIALAVVIQVAAFYSYERHYQACQSWKGWFVCMIGALIVSNLLRRFVMNANKDDDNDDDADPPAPLPVSSSAY